jgi:RecB family exonuclease
MAELFRRQGKGSPAVFASISPDDAAIAQHVLPVSKEELISLYNATWIDDWYPDQSTKDEYRKEGLRMLEQFYEDACVNMPKPMFLEKDFRITVGGYWLKGKIDRIDASASGEEGKVQIIDYKTGTPKLEGKMSADDKKQLVLYQLAASRALGLEVDALTFHYLEDGSKVQFLGSEKDLAKFEDDVAQTIEKISAQDFKETPGMHCSF